MPSGGRATACLLDKKAAISDAVAHRCSTIAGLKRIVVWDAYNKVRVGVRHAQIPRINLDGEDARRPREDASPNTVVVKSACAPGAYYLLWGTELPEESQDEMEAAQDRDGVNDLDGYACTPIERAQVLFDRLLDENLLTEQHSDGGAVTRLLSKTLDRQNGHVSSHTAARHLDPSWRATERLSFVFDFVPCENATFHDLHFIRDAARAPLQQLDDASFELTYGLPRRLSFAAHRPREPLEADLLSAVYS